MSIEWEDPPRPKWGWMKTFVQQLQQRPGEWARYVNSEGRDDLDGSAGTTLKRMGCEVTSRRITGSDPAKYHVWARWPEQQTEGGETDE